MSRTVYFAHGKESGPWGHKITALAEVARRHGLVVESPDYSFTHDPDERVRHLLALNPPTRESLVLVGSSMGGYVAAVASGTLAPAGLFLMAPAVYMPGYEADPVPRAGHVTVVHGWRDDIIPPEHAWRFAERHRAALHMVDDGHTLTASVPTIAALFDRFLESV